MHSLLSAILFSGIAISTPTRRDVSDTSTDMDDVIAGTIPCASNAVIFGRGTFDSGNIGVWVGPSLKDGLLQAFNGDVHVQGVNPSDYPADLYDYVASGGSADCAVGCASTVNQYAAVCPQANIFVSGWSQGALCAHACVNQLNSAATAQLKGMVVFGDENALMDNPASIPSGLAVQAYCITDTVAPDVLCTATLTSGFQLPTSIDDFKQMVVEPLKTLGSLATNPAQIAAALKLPVQLLTGFLGVTSYFLDDVADGKVRRWMVLPPHFKYGNNGMAGDAAAWMASVA